MKDPLVPINAVQEEEPETDADKKAFCISIASVILSIPALIVRPLLPPAELFSAAQLIACAATQGA